MGDKLTGFGANMADMVTGGLIGQGMGLLNDNRQYNQQEKLQNLQIRGQKDMGEYNERLAVQLWNDTGYGAQKKQMKEAGLNPALMYGQGGGAAGSTNVSGGNVTGAAAPSGGGEMPAAMGMQLQMRLMDAQAEQLKSQARLNNVAADKAAGVDTTKAGAEAEGIGLDNQLKKGALGDRLQTIVAERTSAIQKAMQDVNDTNISDATIQAKIEQEQNTAAEQITSIILKQQQAKTEGVKRAEGQSNIQVNAQQIQNMKQQVLTLMNSRINDNKRVLQGDTQNTMEWNRNEAAIKLGIDKLEQDEKKMILDAIEDLTPQKLIIQKPRGESIMNKRQYGQVYKNELDR